MQRIGRRGNDVETIVEAARSLVFGMHDERSQPSEISRGERAQERIFEQSTTDSPPLPVNSNREPR